MYIFHIKPPPAVASGSFYLFDDAKVQKNSINYIFFSLIFAIALS